jgi:two-component system, cell cycle sensor histidine kinase and response regulator CckA
MATWERALTVGVSREEMVARRIVRELPEMVAYWDRDERCRYTNEAHARWFDRTPEQMRGKTMRELLGDHYALSAPYIAAALQGEAQQYARVFRLPSGAVEDVLVTYTPDIDEGIVRGFVAYVRDVSDATRLLSQLHQSDLALRAAQEKQARDEQLHVLLGTIGVGVIVQGPQTEMRMCNPAALDMLGLTEAQLMGRSTLEGGWQAVRADGTPIPPSEHPTACAIATRAPVLGVVMGVHRPRHDDRMWLLVDAVPRFDQGGHVSDVVCTFVNITARHTAEQALIESQRRLEQAVKAGQIGLWESDLTTHAITYSAQWKRNLGYEPHEISDSLDEWISRLHPEDRDRTVAEVYAYVAGEQSESVNAFRLRHKDGRYRHILGRGVKVLDAQGKAVRLVGTAVDISERTELQQQLQHAQKMESVGRLAGGIAHDFNNILTVINTAAELVLHEPDVPEAVRTDVADIRAAGERAALLTRQLLAFSRKQLLSPEPLSLNAVLRSMESMLRRVITENIRLEIVLGDGMGKVLADRGQLEQVVMNLVVNARDAMAAGGTLRIVSQQVHCDAADVGDGVLIPSGDFAQLCISGVGMDEQTARMIFEPFFTTKAPGHGTGLGLSTAYGIVRQSGGIISVESTPNVGTVFDVLLPIVPQATNSAVEELSTTGAHRAAVDTERPVRRAEMGADAHLARILVVEDNDAVRDLLTRCLRHAGYRLLVATSGEEALAMLSRGDVPVDLLLTDVMMPGMNGRELAEQARRVQPSIKVLLTSGYMDEATISDGRLDADTPFIGKPYTPKTIIAAVNALLDAR